MLVMRFNSVLFQLPNSIVFPYYNQIIRVADNLLMKINFIMMEIDSTTITLIH